MAYLMENSNLRLRQATEATYEEVVQAYGGFLVCHLDSTRRTLEMRGYRVIDSGEEEEMARHNGKHAIALGRQGLGPLRRLNDAELDMLEKAWNDGDPDPTITAIAAAEAAFQPNQEIFPGRNGVTALDAARILGLPGTAGLEASSQQRLAEINAGTPETPLTTLSGDVPVNYMADLPNAQNVSEEELQERRDAEAGGYDQIVEHAVTGGQEGSGAENIAGADGEQNTPEAEGRGDSEYKSPEEHS